MTLRRNLTASFIAMAIAAAIVVFSPKPAEAHYLSSDWRYTYKTSGYCTKNYVELSHSSTYPGGTNQSAVEVWYTAPTPWGQVDCFAKETAIQKAQTRSWFWNGSSWYICKDSTPHQFQAAFRSVIWLRYTKPPCGTGYYTSDGAGWNYVNGAWHGGWLALWDYSSTWYHWLPTA